MLVTFALMLVSAALLAAPASAHSALVGTDPVSGAVLAEVPDEVRLTFTEPVRISRDAVQLFDADGKPTATSAVALADAVVVALPEGLPDGTHLLRWRVRSYDGHRLSGDVTFSIRAPNVEGAAVPPRVTAVLPKVDDETTSHRISSALQGIQYVGLLLAAGLTVFLVLLPPSVRRAGSRRLLRVMQGAALLAAAAALGSELVPGLLLAGGLAVAVLTVQVPTRWARAAALLGAALGLTAPSLVGHTRSADPEGLLVVVDVIHLGTGAIWFGGLVGLVLLLPLLAGRDAVAANVLSRFSSLAAGSLVVLVAMGSVLSWRILSSWTHLFDTIYGALLLTKIAIVVVAVGVATVNRFVLLPRVRAGGHGHGGDGTGCLRGAIAVEATLLVLALLVTGFLTSEAPHG